MMRLPFVRSSLQILLLVTASAVMAQGTGRVAGRVVDAEGYPLPDTLVAAGNEQTKPSIFKTDDRGRFEIKDLPPGQYTFRAQLPGFRTERVRIEVKPEDTSVVDFTMRLDECLARTVSVSSHIGLVNSELVARSDLAAHLRIDERIEENSPANLECRVRYRAKVLRTVSRPSVGQVPDATVDVFFDANQGVEPGREYVTLLAWRPDLNAFDAGPYEDGVEWLVNQGRVNTRNGPCVDVGAVVRPSRIRLQGSSDGQLDYLCASTLTVDETLTVFGEALGR